jgi:hypothetical protein
MLEGSDGDRLGPRDRRRRDDRVRAEGNLAPQTRAPVFVAGDRLDALSQHARSHGSLGRQRFNISIILEIQLTLSMPRVINRS